MLSRKYERECMYAETISRVLGVGDRPQKDNKIYLYSTQSLNFKGLAMKEMRERLGKVKGMGFYEDIVCLCVCVCVFQCISVGLSVCLSVCPSPHHHATSFIFYFIFFHFLSMSSPSFPLPSFPPPHSLLLFSPSLLFLDASFSFSQEYVSQSLCLVDMEADKKEIGEDKDSARAYCIVYIAYCILVIGLVVWVEM
jgi:hypothetical protein